MSRKQGKRNQRKQEKKRRLERAKRRSQNIPTAYTGNKYRTEEYVPLHFATEKGIYIADVLTRGELTDSGVEEAITKLILDLRQGRIVPSDLATMPIPHNAADEIDLVALNILDNWQRYVREQPVPSRDALIGVLRSILGSIETWRTAGIQSRGYLDYLEDFLRQMGVTVTLIKDDVEDHWDDEEVEDEVLEVSDESQPQSALTSEVLETGDLMVVGRLWYESGDATAENRFRTLAEHLINAGQAQQVATTCRQLISESPRRSVNADLTALALQADRASQGEGGHDQ